MNYFIFDCETNGLYGETLSICAMVYDESLSVCRKTFYGAWKIAEDKISNDFVRTQVYPYLDSADMFFNSEQELLQHFWQFWKSNREDCRCIADVPVPVEANVFRKCVAMDEQSRWNDAPFPLIDLASILMANNIDPLADRNTLAQSTLTRHNAKNDVLLTVEILRRYLNMDTIYSYHTFFFSFVYSESCSFEGMCKFFDKNEYWLNADFQNVSSLRTKEYYDMKNADIKGSISDYLRWDYQTFQYFNIPTRKAIFGCDSGIVHNYSFNLNKIAEGKRIYYVIRKRNKDGETETFQLVISSISLKIYNTGVAVFSFECENHNDYKIENEKSPQENRNDTRSEKDKIIDEKIGRVKKINEYGRRIFYPFLASGDRAYTLCADKISIYDENNKDTNDNDKAIIVDDFESLFKVNGSDLYQYIYDNGSVFAGKSSTEKSNQSIQLNNVPNIIESFLDFQTDKSKRGEKFTSNVDNKNCKDKIYIYPAIDDRMFVACIVLDDGYGERIRGKDDTESTTGNTNADNSQGTQQNIPQIPEYQKMNEENIYAFQKDYKVATDLYELLYIDTPGGISCPGASMLKKLLNEQMYTRWLDYKTVEGLTHHSFVWVTSGADVGVRESVVNPFLIEYTQMVALCLVQRASIMAFQDKATEIAKEMRNIDKNTVSKTNELIKLQSRYTQFMNEVYFVEITAQEQGIELYDMLKEAMYIEKEREILESQIDKMSEVANTSLDVDLNHVGFWFAIIALFISIVGPFIDVWDIAKEWFGNFYIMGYVGWIVVALIVPISIFCIDFKIKKRK